jgi:amidophosphoribosyltransferase
MCGVVGLIGSKDAAKEAFLSLTTLQHRGQDAAGILSYDSEGFHSVKNVGLVEAVFTREKMATLTGSMAIGHSRYSTVGRGDIIDVQPLVLSFPFGLGMAHNGNIVNVGPLAQDLRRKNRRQLLTRSDTEVVLNIFAEGLAKSVSDSEELEFEQICSAIHDVQSKINGSYSIVTLIAGQGLVAFRDPYGIRPLIWGRRKGGTLPSGEEHIVASESVSLSFLGYEIVRDLAPGEVLFIDMNGKASTRRVLTPAQLPAHHCMFEWVYFASPESVIDQVPVYGSRIQLGKNLAGLIKKQIESGRIKPDIIVPVPETSRIAAIALSEELGVPYREVLIKNRYIKRTFLLDTQDKREKAVNLKLSPVKSEIQGRKVLLVDDSIVRGTTSRKIIELVRNAGAAEVYFVSTCPPIQYPCYYGIDFPNKEELIANGRSVQEIEKILGADAVIYQDMEGLVRSVQGAKGEAHTPCTACLNGKYPTDVASVAGTFSARREQDRLTIRT